MINHLAISTGIVPACQASFLIGILLHVCVFRIGEWHLYTPHLVASVIVVGGSTTAALTVFGTDHGKSLAANGQAVSFALMSCMAGIFSSMLVYRVFLHPLHHFRGPFLARLSNFYVTSLSMKKYQLYKEIRNLHAQYGDLVRVGPSVLSIADPKAYLLIHSNQSRCSKGPWYDIFYPVRSLHMVRDRNEHARRRKAWDKAFSFKALREYEPRVQEYSRKLLHQVEMSRGKPLNVTTWFNFFSFDVMGDLAFNKSFNMLRDGVVHYFMATIQSSLLFTTSFRHLVWIFTLVKAIPGLTAPHARFQKWLAEQVDQRRRRVIEAPDVFSWVLADFEKSGSKSKKDLLNLRGDAHLIVIAGSDTTAATLTCLFFELARNPEITAKLRRELDGYFAVNKTPDMVSLSKLVYLGACIDEALRLYPPVLSGLERLTPPEGLQLGKVHIPGDTIVQLPTYTLHRDERSFVHAEEFIPERWTTRPELVKDASVFSPFSTGRYGCVGKQLALLELRDVTSRIVHQYDIRMAPGQTEEAFLSGFKDLFAVTCGKLELVFERLGEKGIVE